MTQTRVAKQGPSKAEVLKAVAQLQAQLSALAPALAQMMAEDDDEPGQVSEDKLIHQRLALYLEALDKAAAVHFQAADYTWASPIYQAEPGTKYIKIVQVDDNGSRSVHAFVEAVTGKVCKSAGWNAPAKSMAAATKGELLSQYSLGDTESYLELMQLLVDNAAKGVHHGGYLYKGSK